MEKGCYTGPQAIRKSVVVLDFEVGNKMAFAYHPQSFWRSRL
jgi:hypothetical protein